MPQRAHRLCKSCIGAHASDDPDQLSVIGLIRNAEFPASARRRCLFPYPFPQFPTLSLRFVFSSVLAFGCAVAEQSRPGARKRRA